MLSVRGEVLIIESAAIAAAVTVWVKGDAGHEHQRRLVVRRGLVRDGLRDVICAGGDGGQVVEPQKFHLVAKYLRHGDALAVALRLLQDRQRAHLLIIRQVAVDRPRGAVCRMRKELLRQKRAGALDLPRAQGAFFLPHLRAERFFIHKTASRLILHPILQNKSRPVNAKSRV